MSDQAGILPKWFSNWGIILAEGQLGHSYTFWTMLILIYSILAQSTYETHSTKFALKADLQQLDSKFHTSGWKKGRPKQLPRKIQTEKKVHKKINQNYLIDINSAVSEEEQH